MRDQKETTCGLSFEADSNANLGFSAAILQSLLVLVRLEFTGISHCYMYKIRGIYDNMYNVSL